MYIRYQIKYRRAIYYSYIFKYIKNEIRNGKEKKRICFYLSIRKDKRKVFVFIIIFLFKQKGKEKKR